MKKSKKNIKRNIKKTLILGDLKSKKDVKGGDYMARPEGMDVRPTHR